MLTAQQKFILAALLVLTFGAGWFGGTLYTRGSETCSGSSVIHACVKAHVESGGYSEHQAFARCMSF